MKRLSFFLFVMIFAGISTAGVKYVAVVETDVDAQSGVSAKLNPAEVREITAELRRQATENLPPDKYSVMTSETVQSMGGTVLEECAEENCVIVLGSRIGADYIVRGTVSKFQTMFTLAIELYETENGTLVVSSEAVRSENLVELLNKAGVASANMYKKFAGVKGLVQKKSKAESEVVAQRSESAVSNLKTIGPPRYNAIQYQLPVGTPVSWGGVYFEGGWIWNNGVFFGSGLGGGGEGSADTLNLFAGAYFNLGKVYDLPYQLQLFYGLSVGIWLVGSDGTDYNDYGYVSYIALNYLAPFIKLRWNYVELTYKGLLGYREVWKGRIEEVGGEKIDDTNFGWNNHQLMIGIYFKRKPLMWREK